MPEMQDTAHASTLIKLGQIQILLFGSVVNQVSDDDPVLTLVWTNNLVTSIANILSIKCALYLPLVIRKQ